jgi:hypothetical protein
MPTCATFVFRHFIAQNRTGQVGVPGALAGVCTIEPDALVSVCALKTPLRRRDTQNTQFISFFAYQIRLEPRKPFSMERAGNLGIGCKTFDFPFNS